MTAPPAVSVAFLTRAGRMRSQACTGSETCGGKCVALVKVPGLDHVWPITDAMQWPVGVPFKYADTAGWTKELKDQVFEHYRRIFGLSQAEMDAVAAKECVFEASQVWGPPPAFQPRPTHPVS